MQPHQEPACTRHAHAEQSIHMLTAVMDGETYHAVAARYGIRVLLLSGA